MDQQPLLTRFFGLRPPTSETRGPDQDERPAQLHAIQFEFELAVREGARCIRRLRVGAIRAPIPHDDIARTVLPRRDVPLEIDVSDRVVLDLDG